MGLFETSRPTRATFDRSFGATVRTQLDEHSWVDHIPGWLSGSDVLLHDLLTTPTWEQREYDGLWINQYRTHVDSTSWHADWPSCKREVCVVPVLSLGATRRFLVRARAGGPSRVFQPAAGDLIVMGGRCQKDWLHCVPKQTKQAGVRVSVNFKSSWQAMTE